MSNWTQGRSRDKLHPLQDPVGRRSASWNDHFGQSQRHLLGRDPNWQRWLPWDPKGNFVGTTWMDFATQDSTFFTCFYTSGGARVLNQQSWKLENVFRQEDAWIFFHFPDCGRGVKGWNWSEITNQSRFESKWLALKEWIVMIGVTSVATCAFGILMWNVQWTGMKWAFHYKL